MLGRLSMPGRPTNLENSKAWVYCACSRWGWGCLDIFFSRLHFLLFSSRYRLKYFSKGEITGLFPVLFFVLFCNLK